MMPAFPNTRELRLADRVNVEAVTGCFPPYSDFNFISLWSWNITSSTRVCLHNGNLTLRFADYLTSEPFYMLIGRSTLTQTARDLIADSERQGFGSRLRLIPQCVAATLDPKVLTARPSADHQDYIVDVGSLADCEGRKWHRHRNFLHRFEREHPSARFELLDLADPKAQARILKLFDDWGERKETDTCESIAHEREALSRCIGSFASELIGGGIYVADRLVAFALVEPVGNGYAVEHFEKADRWSFVGVVQFLQWCIARELLGRGVRYLNLEQDLGLPGLRRAKRAQHPVAYLQKYDVVLAPNHGGEVGFGLSSAAIV